MVGGCHVSRIRCALDDEELVSCDAADGGGDHNAKCDDTTRNAQLACNALHL